MPQEYKFEWEKLLQAALAERNVDKLSKKVVAAETAIFLRLQGLEHSSDSSEERSALQDASNTLLALKRDGLKFPDWQPE